MRRELIKKSRFLSLVLRHNPSAAFVKLDENGWVNTSTLLKGMAKTGKSLTLAELREIVETNEKKRFAFNEDESKIRASQGHSLEVDLEMVVRHPPETLYHGTATKSITAIFDEGLVKMNRQHVHLSADEATATNVGSRHGSVIVLRVLALEMAQAGYSFYQSENGVWLTDAVPVDFIEGFSENLCEQV